MKRTRLITIVVVILALLGLSLNMTALPAAAQSGRHITSAIFSIYVNHPGGEQVNVHQILVPWVEGNGSPGSGVTWNSFNCIPPGGACPNHDPAVIGSFTTAGVGWYTVDVTTLVQYWVDHPLQNYGLLLDEPSALTVWTTYNSSEFATIDLRPKLDIDYTAPDGTGATHVTIQRGTHGAVADDFIESLFPTDNFGDADYLMTGRNEVTTYKQTLIRFELTTPTAVTLQSLNARASSVPDTALPAIGVFAIVGVAILGLRRTSKRPSS